MKKEPLLLLSNKMIEVGILPDIGGRVVLLRRPGGENMFKADHRQWKDPKRLRPELSAFSRFKAFNGHEVWLGPQGDWWKHQDENLYRKRTARIWPPDPYHSYGTNRITHYTDRAVTLEGLRSPLTGIQLTRTITLADDGKVAFRVRGTNIREQPVSWDLWFNTRIDGYAHSYVPVESEESVRVASRKSATSGAAYWEVRDGFFRFIPRKPAPTHWRRNAKAFIRPACGVIAAFHQSQLLEIRFRLYSQKSIHPRQGQVEIYNCAARTSESSLTELEYHAPYKTLKPGESMEASQTWRLHEFDGRDTAKNRIEYLKEELRI